MRWLTPLTCDDKVPLPTLRMLREEDHCVGRVGDVYQLITVTKTTKTVSPEFSAYYGTLVHIYKKPVVYRS